MAKNKKVTNMKLEQTELMPIKIGEFESRRKNSIGVFIIITIFITIIFFLPQISDFINSYLHPKTTPTTPTVTPTNPKSEDKEKTDKNTLYTYTSSLEIKNDNLTLNSFKIENNTISFSLTNNGKETDLQKLNYYLEIYNNDKTFIERVKVVNENNISIGSTITIKRNINSTTASTIGYISLVKKTIVEYPEYTININSEKIGTLICNRENEKVTYKFNDNKLIEVSSEVNHLKTEDNYIITYNKDIKSVAEYSSRLGITSSIFEYTDGYNITTNVNLNEASRSFIFNADTFSKDTEVKVVKFEMEAQNFTCK